MGLIWRRNGTAAKLNGGEMRYDLLKMTNVRLIVQSLLIVIVHF